MSKRLLIVVAVVLAVALAAGAGYVLGVRAVMRQMRVQAAPAEGPQQRGIPYSGLNCDLCRENFPDWWCWLGGCP